MHLKRWPRMGYMPHRSQPTPKCTYSETALQHGVTEIFYKSKKRLAGDQQTRLSLRLIPEVQHWQYRGAHLSGWAVPPAVSPGTGGA